MAANDRFDPYHKFTVDETVLMVAGYRNEVEEATVVKVGRTLVHVRAHGAVFKFYKQNRTMQNDFVGRVLYTPGEHEANKRRGEVLRALLEEHRLRWEYGVYQPSTGALEEILAVLDRYRKKDESGG